MHKVIYNRGAQTLTHVPQDRLSRPTLVASATYRILDLTEGDTSAQREVVASTAATVDSFATTLSAAAGSTTANASLLSVYSVAGLAEGEKLLLSTVGGGLREQVTVLSVRTSSIITQRPIRGSYGIADTLEGIEMSATFPLAVADDEDLAIRDNRDYYIVWSYTIDGEPWEVRESIDVERYSLASWIGPDDLILGHPSLATRGKQGMLHDALALATEEVAGELEASQVRPEYYRPTIAGRVAVRYLALHHIFRQFHGDADRDTSDMYRERYKQQIHQMIEGRPEGARLISRNDETTRPQGNDLDILVPT